MCAGKCFSCKLAFYRGLLCFFFAEFKERACMSGHYYNCEMTLIFICRDAKLMANDVDKALSEIVSEKGEMELTKAQEYLKR